MNVILDARARLESCAAVAHVSILQTVRSVLDNTSLFFLHQPLRNIARELAASLGFLKEWTVLQKRQATCRHGDRDVRRKIVQINGFNLRLAPDGAVLGCAA